MDKPKSFLKKFVKKNKMYIIVLIVGIFVGLGILGAPAIFKHFSSVSGNTLQYGLNDFSMLDTQEYFYTHLAVYDSTNKVWEVDVPFTQTKVIYSYDGTVTAGVDFSQIIVENYNKTITVKMPEAQITHSTIDEDSFKLYDERSSIFNPFTITNMNDVLKDIKQKEEQKAIEKGILAKAYDNAIDLVEKFLRQTYDINDYTIEFKSL